MSTRRESRRDKLVRRAALLRLVLRHPQNRERPWRALARIVGWQLWRLTVRRPMTSRFWSGLRVRVYPDWPYSWTAIYLGLAEYDEMLFTLRFLRTDDAIVDVGANIGYYSLLGSSVNGGAPVVAFEPHPVASERLRENASINGLGNIDVRPVAAGDHNTTARLTTDLADMNRIETSGATDEPTVSVGVVTIDSEIARLHIDPARIRLVKIDTEGFEARVLQGATALLQRNPGPVWLVELTGLGERYGSGDDAISEVFRKLGYKAFRYAADGNRISRIDPHDGVRGNVIFAKHTSMLSTRLGTPIATSEEKADSRSAA